MRKKAATYVDTPRGLFTASGIWFTANEASLQEYAGPVLERESLEHLLAQSESWIESARTLALWVAPLMLIAGFAPLLSIFMAVALFTFWEVVGPSFVNRPMASVFGMLQNVIVQGVYYVTILSVLAAWDERSAVVAGIVIFVLFRWNMVGRIVRPLILPIWRNLYPMPVPDQILRLFILRAAMSHRVPLPQIEQMEKDILSRWSRK